MVAPTPASPLVLIVDDDNSLRTLLRLAMQREGYRTEQAANGQEALKKFEQLQPDMILLDAIMPEMDGFICCQKLRQLASGDQVPVLMITFLDDQESVDQAFASGASDYITKPIHWGVLVQRVRRLLESQKAIALLQSLQAEQQEQQVWEKLFRETLQQFTQSRAMLPLLQGTLTATQLRLKSDRLLLSYPDKKLFLEVLAPNVPSVRSLLETDWGFLNLYESYYLTGQILTINNGKTENLEPIVMETLQNLDCQALVHVPMIKGDRLLGVLSVQSHLPRNWTTAEIERLGMWANLLALILSSS